MVGTIGAVAALAVTEQDDSAQRDPAAHGVHDDGTGEVMELGAEEFFHHHLKAVVAVPGHAFEERVHQSD